MNVRILESAWQDLRQGYAFYEEREPGVGEYFLDQLFSEIDSLSLHAGIHPLRHGCYRMLSRKFPYAVYYNIDQGEAVVRGVLDCRRDPLWIRRRLSQGRD
jgi:plasmid stabilization system protein ParE